jgi:nucleotide-binding universal stress UspA family protein
MKTRPSKRRLVETAVGAAIGAAIAGPAGAVAGGLAARTAAPRIADLGKRKRSGKRTRPDADDPMIHAQLRHILVPVDFSPPSLHAVRFAQKWAARFRAGVCLLHVIEPMSTVVPFGAEVMMPPPPPPDFRKKIRLELEKLATKGAARAMKVSVQICDGVAHHEIVNAARKLKSDIIIIASHGYSGLMRTLMGSTAERVVRHAPCPVLTLRTRGSGNSHAATRS